MVNKLSHSDKLIIIRNENEIRELVALKKRTLEEMDKDINDLIKQNREIKGRA
nr:MAG TPA: hypothetical protein [Caudoviricetes sp.]